MMNIRSVLQAAGFVVRERRPDAARRGSFSQVARIVSYRRVSPLGSTTVFVQLTPDDFETWSRVGIVDADISVAFP